MLTAIRNLVIVSGNLSRKDLFHRRAKHMCKIIAEIMKDNPDIRTNKGGPAVMGETTYHGDKIYIQFGDNGIMYRCVKSKKDYVGGRNNWIVYSNFEQYFDSFIKHLRTMQQSEVMI